MEVGGRNALYWFELELELRLHAPGPVQVVLHELELFLMGAITHVNDAPFLLFLETMMLREEREELDTLQNGVTGEI